MKLSGVRRLVRLPVADSTQDQARRLAEAGAPSGTLVWALEQTGGRGRLGRRWRSPRGGLYATWILRPSFAPERLAAFSPAVGAAVAAALGDLGVESAVKAPNDALVRCADGRWRKAAGVLCEASGGERSLDWLLVGVGVNVDNEPGLARAVSLRQALGRPVGLEPVLRALMRRLESARRRGGFA